MTTTTKPTSRKARGGALSRGGPKVQPARGPEVQIPRAFGFLFTPARGKVRWRVAYGGRGSAKSWQFARALLLLGVQEPLRILCAREFQASIKDSVLRLLADQIVLLGLAAFYRVTKTGILGANGTEFLFKGLRHDVMEIKSLERIDICWVEEAQAVSKESWEVLEPTIRNDGSEIWVTFNPGEPEDPTYVRLVTDELPESIVRKVGYRDNPWLPAVLLKAARRLKRRDPEAYAHVWGGEPWQRSELQVFAGKYAVEDFTPQEHWHGPYFGLDFGFSVDPAVAVRLFIADSRLYIASEAGGVKLDSDDLARKVIGLPGARDHRIYADSARPETINELKRRGLKVVGAPKWDGSVKDGVEYLRGSFERIIIHPSCSRAIEEARLYRYKADPKTGDPLPKLVDRHNHVWDAVRYALSPLIKRGRMHEVWYPGMTDAAED